MLEWDYDMENVHRPPPNNMNYLKYFIQHPLKRWVDDRKVNINMNIFKLSSAQNDLILSNYRDTCNFISDKKTLVIGCSNRWMHPNQKREISKTEKLGRMIVKHGAKGSEYIHAESLKIYSCEANISRASGNNCGVADASLKDKNKNPSGDHRCWASINNKDDELWKISKPLLEADAVIFIAPVRWGQACANYQKIIERLSWIENRRTTLKDKNIVANINAGFICIGHNWNAENVANTQKKVLEFFGFKTPAELSWSYQWTKDSSDESADGYKKDAKDFDKMVELTINKT